MIQILINGQAVDLNDDIQVGLNYKVNDLENPSAVKNSYSKTITVNGTRNNNIIFGNLWSLDRSLYEGTSDNGGTGVGFDARKRVDALILDNGNIVEKGYVRLDSVTNTDGIVQYSFTFFGGLGDFFYNLMYGEDGEEKTLGDLYYGFTDSAGKTMTAEQEAVNNIAQWNFNWIGTSWDKLAETRDNTDMLPNNWITAAPTYSGYYDNFDSSKFLLNVGPDGSKIPSSIRALFNTNQTGDTVGSPIDNYYLVTANRDMSEWEARDFRSLYQRPAFKNELIFNAISNPINNGGYTVEWDDEVKKSRYYKDSWTILPRLDFSNDEKDDDEYGVYWSGGTAPASSYGNLWKEYSLVDGSGNTTFDTTSMISPKLRISLQPVVEMNKNADYAYTTYKQYKQYRIGGFGVKVIILDQNDDILEVSPYYFLTTNTQDNDFDFYYYKYYNRLRSLLGVSSATTISVREEENLKRIENYNSRFFYSFENPLKIDIALPAASGFKIIVKTGFFAEDSLFNGTMGYEKNDEFGWTVNWTSTTDFASGALQGILDGQSSDIQKMNVTKAILFGNPPQTPFNFLVSFTKLLGLRYELDSFEKKVRIMLRRNYYKDTVVDISDRIDRKKKMEIIPTVIENKWYRYGLETPATYADYLYKKKRNKEDYGVFKQNTNYYFNNEIKEVFEDNIFKNVIPYRLNSICFNNILIDGTSYNYPPVTLLQKYTTTSWYNGSTQDFDSYGYSAENVVKNLLDDVPKFCMFDDNSSF